MHSKLLDLKKRYEPLFDECRIVDCSKKITYFLDSEDKLNQRPCHLLCKVKNDCNCSKVISEKRKITRIEFIEGKSFIINAFLLDANENLVVELIDQIDGSNYYHGSDQGKHSDITSIIENMSQMIVTDEMTALYNRRYISQRLPLDLARCHDTGKSIAIIMADIDKFKSVNDKYGHTVGDKVLISFAKLLKSSIRNESDWVARYGGEEFLIVVQDFDIKSSRIVVENIKKKISNAYYDTGDKKIKLTCSFGAVICKDKSESYEALIRLADSCLLEAKNNGRNKAVIQFL